MELRNDIERETDSNVILNHIKSIDGRYIIAQDIVWGCIKTSPTVGFQQSQAKAIIILLGLTKTS